MNDSERERFPIGDEEQALVEAGVQLLPIIGRALYSAITELGQTYDLTQTQVKVLLHLGSRRQMTVGEIAEALGVSMPAASELVDRLVDAGHLVRASDPADRRRVLIAATPESARISAELRGMREAQVRYALGQLAPEERPAFIRSLQALVAGLRHARGAEAGSCNGDGAGGTRRSDLLAAEMTSRAGKAVSR